MLTKLDLRGLYYKGWRNSGKSVLLMLLTLLSACAVVPSNPANPPNALNPSGPNAARITELWWLMFGIGTVIFLLVIGLLFAALLRGRRATSETVPDASGDDTGRNWLLRGGIILPLIVLAVVFGYSVFTLAQIARLQNRAALKIQVTGRRWWWEVNYPDQGITTANEIHFPVGVPVQIELQAADVIHSFWIPQLAGKMDLIPTRINTITIQADQAGVYRGECAEYCGLQHAHMAFMVVAESSQDYDAWVKAQQQPAAAPTSDPAKRGQQVFMNEGKCVFCHTVRGLDDKNVDASGVDLGPDLTHLFSRLTIAGASLTTNEGNLAGWIIDAQHVKPGSLMPNVALNADDLQALLVYLQTLH